MLSALLLALLLPGCSTVRLAYSNAPELSYWWLDSYLDLGEVQSFKVRADLATLHTWHRASELPAYVDTLDKLQRMGAANLHPEQVCDLYGELKTRYRALLEQLELPLVALAPTLKPEQLDHLARQFDKRNRKWRAQWLDRSPAERGELHLRQFVERAEMLYGRLEEPQLVLLRVSLAASGFDADLNQRETLRRQQDALQTLRSLQGGVQDALQARVAVRALLARSLDSPDPAHRSYVDKLALANCRALAALHNGATPAQRLKALETVRGYTADAQALLAPRPGGA